MVSVMFCFKRILPTLVFAAAAVSISTAALAQASVFPCTISPTESLIDQQMRFLLAGLVFQPVEAAQAGYHGDASHPIDSQLDHNDAASLAAQHALLLAGKACFAAAKAKTNEDAADLILTRDAIESSLYELDMLQSYRYRPQDYPEMIGSGLFFPLTESRGSEAARLAAVVAERMPKRRAS
jgi:hypothetical protein